MNMQRGHESDAPSQGRCLVASPDDVNECTGLVERGRMAGRVKTLHSSTHIRDVVPIMIMLMFFRVQSLGRIQHMKRASTLSFTPRATLLDIPHKSNHTR